MTIKVTLKIQQATGGEPDPVTGRVAGPNRLAGWTESWYYDGLDMPAARAAVLPPAVQLPGKPANALVPYRARLLPTSAVIVQATFQIVDGRSPVDAVPLAVAGRSDLAPDLPQCTLLVRVTTRDGNQTNHYLRGLPDARAAGGEYDAGNEAYETALANYLGFLPQFQLRVRSRAPLAPKIDRIETDGTVRLLGASDATVGGEPVRVLRTIDACKRRRGGLFTVTATNEAARTVTIAGWTYGVTKGGRLRRELIRPSQILRAVAVRVVPHKVGRPFALSSGRRSARR